MTHSEPHTTPGDTNELRARALRCPCGLELVGADEDTLVQVAQEHLVALHPQLAGSYSRDDVLSLSYPTVRGHS